MEEPTGYSPSRVIPPAPCPLSLPWATPQLLPLPLLRPPPPPSAPCPGQSYSPSALHPYLQPRHCFSFISAFATPSYSTFPQRHDKHFWLVPFWHTVLSFGAWGSPNLLPQSTPAALATSHLPVRPCIAINSLFDLMRSNTKGTVRLWKKLTRLHHSTVL